MRKLAVLMLCTVFLFFPVVFVNAATIGGAQTQGQNQFSVGINQQIVFDKDLKLKKLFPDSGTKISDSEIDAMNRTQAKISYGILENLDIYTTIGIADLKTEENWLTAAAERGSIAADTKTGAVWGLGLTGVIGPGDDWSMGADLQYLTHRNKYNKGRIDNQTSPGDSEDFSGKMTVKEWQIAPYMAKKIGGFTPYLGLRYSDMRINDKYTASSGDTQEKKEADDNVGIFIGTDYSITDNWKVNLEASFVDDTAISFGTSYRF